MTSRGGNSAARPPHYSFRKICGLAPQKCSPISMSLTREGCMSAFSVPNSCNTVNKSPYSRILGSSSFANSNFSMISHTFWRKGVNVRGKVVVYMVGVVKKPCAGYIYSYYKKGARKLLLKFRFALYRYPCCGIFHRLPKTSDFVSSNMESKRFMTVSGKITLPYSWGLIYTGNLIGYCPNERGLVCNL